MKVYPNLIVPGFPKSGTSSLYYYLDQHPDINGIYGKEPHIFSKPERYSRWQEVCQKGFDLEDSYQYRLDASTTYMISREAPSRIAETAPQCKIIILARDPIERVFSHYNWLWCLGRIENSFEKEIRYWDDRAFDPSCHDRGNYKYYVEFSRYGRQFQRYVDTFSRDRILYLTTEELKENADRVLDRCFNFLELPQLGNVDKGRRNVTKTNDVTRYPGFMMRLRTFLPDALVNIFPRNRVRSWFTETYEPQTFGPEEERLVFQLLEPDLRLQNNLGILSDRWTTTRKYL
ncbi:hypothetical protein CRI94_14025 [Longibacter salinarum]|uniref:Sulfotransferase domain-containing protein n=1 Tax=Longibacter salinarum TaxID=1850348 RepID=A0A2A8CW56_9BACT|nr:hypothetical protein CRI94_14025 [Longibacter salinarum]